MKTILVATDFSESAINAAEYAARLGMQVKADYLILYHAYQLLPVSTDITADTFPSEEKMQEYKEDFLGEIRQNLASVVEQEMLILTRAEASALDKGINDMVAVCQEEGLLVIGSSTYRTGRLRRSWKDTGTSKMMKVSSLPLLIVPRTAKFQPIKKVLLACDLEDVADTIPLTKLRQLIKSLQAELLVVHVNRPFRNGNSIRESVSFYDLFEDLDPSIKFIEGNDISKEVLACAATYGAQMVVAVAKDHSFIERKLRKSISKELALESDLPILIIRK